MEFVRVFKRQIDKLVYIYKLRGWKKCCFVMGIPNHGNIGDSAIVIAQHKLLETAQRKRVIELTWEQFNGYYSSIIQKSLFPFDTICMHGGGNLGDVWPNEEHDRRIFLKSHSNKKILIFPQTFHYENSNNILESIDYYNRPNMYIVAREKTSYDLLKNTYPCANILLCPDTVLSLDAISLNCKREGIAMCMRRDKEKALLSDDQIRMREYLVGVDTAITETDTVIDRSITSDNRENVVFGKLRELASRRLVITDRLHGMVFCAITGTPCIVLSNNNHKVKGTYEWISYLPYIKYAETVDEAVGYIPELLKMENCVYDNTPLQPYFDELRKAVREL